MTVEQESTEDPQEPTPSIAEQMAADLTELAADPPVDPPVETGTDPETGTEPATGSEPQPTPQTLKIGETEVPLEQVGGIENLIAWASSLTDEQAEQVMRITRGEPATPPVVEPEQIEVVDPIAAIEQDYPDVAAAMRAQAEAIERLTAQEQRLEQLESVTAAEVSRNTQQAAIEAEATVKAAFLEANGLDDGEYARLADRVGSLKILPALAESLGLEGGMRTALDLALGADPDLQAKAMQQKLAALNVSSTVARKAGLAAGLSPQGGSQPKTTAAGSTGLPVDQRRAAMAEEIRQIVES